MRVIGTPLAVAAVLVAAIAHAAHAQRRPAPTTATKANASAPAPDENGGKTNFTLFAGIATGDSYDLGFAVQGSFRIPLPTVPIAIRIDPYLARHGGGSDYQVGTTSTSTSLTLLGVAGDAEYTFKTTGSEVEPYVLAGLGIYHGSGGGGGSTDLGLGIGGGIRFMKRWVAEAQFKSINSFSTIPLMVGYHF